MASRLSTILAELKRRKVYHVAVVYVLVGLGVAQGADWAFDLMELPNVASQLVAVLLVLGLPVALVLAWAYEIRPENPAELGEARDYPGAPPTSPGRLGSPGSDSHGSIAVLPFANTSDDPEAEYFSDGMTEEIINALAQVEGLQVAARTSSFSFKGTTPEIAEVGARLGVATVLEGSVRKAGGRLRITAQLVNVSDGFHLWSERYDRQMEDVFAIQDEIARAIAGRLQVTLAGRPGDRLVEPATDNLEAYDLYLKGRFFVTQGGEGTRKALDFFEQALVLDPRYALAHAGVSEAYVWLGGTGIMRPKEALPKAREAAVRALELGEDLAETHFQMGQLAWSLDLDWSEAEGHFLRALELNPGLPEVHSLHGFFLASLGRFEASLAELRRGIELDPLSQVAHIWLGQVQAWLGEFPESIDRLRTALDLDPTSWNANHILGMALRLNSAYGEAIETLKKAMALAGRHPWSLMELALASVAVGDRSQAEATYDELLARWRSEYVPPTNVAFLCAALGRVDEAFDWLERGFEEQDTLMTWIAILPHYDALRGDPRFPGLVERMGLEGVDGRRMTPSG